MNAIRVALSVACLALASAGSVDSARAAQPEANTAAPAKGVSAAQVEKNKAVGREFFRPGITVKERYDLLDDGYIQHNPGAKKYADDRHLSYKEGFFKQFSEMGGFPGPPAGAPKGNDLYMVLGEGDLVFIMRQQYQQDPTAAPGTFYASYGWDVFRVKNGKLNEHWDGAMIRPPGAGAAMGGGPGAPGGPAGRGAPPATPPK